MERIGKIWELLPEHIQESLRTAVETNRDLSRRGGNTSIRDCPRCGDGNTIDCREVADIADATVGLCLSCGYLWCLECDAVLLTSVNCGHWAICAHCVEQKGASGECTKVAWKCEHIRQWLEKTYPRV
jgi:long-subunit acyl-CoA synthetase (AMP-forming)